MQWMLPPPPPPRINPCCDVVCSKQIKIYLRMSNSEETCEVKTWKYSPITINYSYTCIILINGFVVIFSWNVAIFISISIFSAGCWVRRWSTHFLNLLHYLARVPSGRLNMYSILDQWEDIYHCCQTLGNYSFSCLYTFMCTTTWPLSVSFYMA